MLGVENYIKAVSITATQLFVENIILKLKLSDDFIFSKGKKYKKKNISPIKEFVTARGIENIEDLKRVIDKDTEENKCLCFSFDSLIDQVLRAREEYPGHKIKFYKLPEAFGIPSFSYVCQKTGASIRASFQQSIMSGQKIYSLACRFRMVKDDE